MVRMETRSRITAASASTLNAPGAARFSQPAAKRGEAAGQPIPIGVGSSAPVVEPSNLTAGAGTPNARNISRIGAELPSQVAHGSPTGEAGASNLSTVYGPPITHRLEGAGGPANPWDNKIAAAHRRGNHLLAQRLQVARAKINLAFSHLEPVWIPTDSQRVMLGLLACPTGLRVMDAA